LTNELVQKTMRIFSRDIDRFLRNLTIIITLDGRIISHVTFSRINLISRCNDRSLRNLRKFGKLEKW